MSPGKTLWPASYPLDRGSLRCVSQWGDFERNDQVVMRRIDPSGLEVSLAHTTRSQSHDWDSDGYLSREEYLFWSRKVCGLACLQSLLHGWTDVRLSMRDLLTQALAWGCYRMEPTGTVRGLLYRPFMAWVSSQFGFDCRLIERTPIHLSSRQVRPDQVMLASVSAEIRDPDTSDPRQGGHLVLVYGVEGGLLRFHNPSGYSHNSDSASLPVDVFARFHANRGVLISKHS